jgi:hypothetical protein
MALPNTPVNPHKKTAMFNWINAFRIGSKIIADCAGFDMDLVDVLYENFEDNLLTCFYSLIELCLRRSVQQENAIHLLSLYHSERSEESEN